jgi:hypothetical protein
MPLNFQPGDFLVYQLESGFALLRLLARDETENGLVWHVAAYDNLFFDVDSAEAAIQQRQLVVGYPHFALTNRAFESTQVAKIDNIPLADTETTVLSAWRNDPGRQVSDRSVRLMVGLR